MNIADCRLSIADLFRRRNSEIGNRQLAIGN